MQCRLLDPRPAHGARRRSSTGLAVAAVLLAACASVESQTPPSKETVVADVNLQTVTAAALADATRLTGIERGKLVLVTAEAVTWQDGSLGCPEEGMQYTMAVVPGYRVLIRAGDRLLDYHASARGGVSLCPEGRAMDPLPGDSRI